MPEPQARYLRFAISDRVEHLVQVVTFVMLALTGLVQKYADGSVSEWFIARFGGIEQTRIIHRLFATILLLAIVYHVGTAGYRIFVKRARRTMLPGRADFRAAWQTLTFNLGLRKERPLEDRFTFEEKIEYWAIVWGTVIMAVTGFMLWNPIATSRILPGDFIPAAKAAHGNEALLAVLAIIIWHIYHVHIRHFNRSIFTGYLSRQEMERYHPLELARLEAGENGEPDAATVQRRWRAFWPSYGVLAGVMLAGVYFFVNFESTAITTVAPSPENVEVFAPRPTPTVPLDTTTTLPGATTTVPGSTTTTPAAQDSWQGTFAVLFTSRCASCHAASTGFGGLNVSTYAQAVEGGDSGPGIVPGDPAASEIYVVQAAGGHPGQLNDEELARLEAWISAGAPETAAAAGGGAVTWTSTVGPLFGQCSACHGASGGRGGLSLATYRSALDGGDAGPGIVPGDPDASEIYIIQEAGGHPGQLSDADLATLKAWIEAGAPE